jgi:SAM-dependent methyltransferase
MDEGYFRHIIEHPELSTRDVAIIRKHQPDARRIVDIGCGRGGFVAICRQELRDALGIDNEPAAARICRAQGLPFVLADAQQLPFASDCLDVVRAKEIIEHLPDPRPMLREIHRALRPGGLFLSRVPSHFSALYPIGNFWDDYTHVRPLSRLALRRLLDDTGFEIDFISGYTAGRNAAERLLGWVLGRVLPHTWLAVARKPQS